MIRGKLEGPRESLKYEKARTVCLYLKLTHWSVAHSWLPLVWIPLSFCSCRVSMLFYHQDLGTIFLQVLLILPFNSLTLPLNQQRLYYKITKIIIYAIIDHHLKKNKFHLTLYFIAWHLSILLYLIWTIAYEKKNSHMRGISSNSIICTIFAPTYERMSKGVVTPWTPSRYRVRLTILMIAFDNC